jgi:hypothetical protein
LFRIASIAFKVTIVVCFAIVIVWLFAPSKRLSHYFESFLNYQLTPHYRVSIDDMDTFYNGFTLKKVKITVPGITSKVEVQWLKVFNDSWTSVFNREIKYKMRLYEGVVDGVTVLSQPYESSIIMHKLNLDNFKEIPWKTYTSSPVVFDASVNGQWEDFPVGKIYFDVEKQYINLKKFNKDLPRKLYLKTMEGSAVFNDQRLVTEIFMTGDFTGELKGEIFKYRQKGREDIKITVKGKLKNSFVRKHHSLNRELQKRKWLGRKFEFEIRGNTLRPRASVIFPQ